jgi:hypothetical protein
MILHRCFAWDREAPPAAAGGALWFAREYQGDGRHDNPGTYGCLYLTAERLSAVVEQLARFRGAMLAPTLLRRRGFPLALASIDLDDRAALVDLDDPRVLAARRLRPSLVATRRRDVTQPQALALYRQGADGVRWWSTFESLWPNVTVFDRAARRLRLREVRTLELGDAPVREAADFLGLAPG